MLEISLLKFHFFHTSSRYLFILFIPTCLWSFLRRLWLFFFFLPELSETGDIEDTQLYQTWFKLVLEKNRLARYESELMILWVIVHGLKNGKQNIPLNELYVFSIWIDVEFDLSYLAYLFSIIRIFKYLLSAQELELEDTQSRLQQDLRQRMATEGNDATHIQLHECSSMDI